MMSGDPLKNTGQCPNFDRAVIGNYFVVLAIPLRGHTDMGALLPSRLIAQSSERSNQSWSVDIARQFHRGQVFSFGLGKKRVAASQGGSRAPFNWLQTSTKDRVANDDFTRVRVILGIYLASTSSRTKWSRMIFGAGIVSSK